MSEIKIEKGIPLPPDGRANAKYPWTGLEVGDSFVADEIKRGPMCASARRFGIEVTVRKINDGKVRVWRTK